MKKSFYKIFSIIFIFILSIILNSFCNRTFAINITSSYYKIDTTNKIISRLGPKTSVEIFKKATNIQTGELKVYKDGSLREEVTTGNIGTGMVATDETGRDIYQISVIGDLDGDGIASQIEVTYIINNLTGLNGYNLEGLQKISADFNGDGVVNQIDVTKYINYIVYGELDIKRPEPDFDLVAPEVNVSVQNKTTSTITVKASATDDKEMSDPFVYIYYIKEAGQPDSAYEHKKSTQENTFTFTRLKMNKNYTIKVETADGAGNKGVKEITVKTGGDGDILDGTVQIGSPVWENGKATVTVTTDVEYDIEYQINGGEWIKLPEGQNTITNLNNGDTVNARTTDGTNTGNYSTVTIQDGDPPTIDLELGEPTTSKIQATVSNAKDDQTGLETPITYKFYIKKTSENDNAYRAIEPTTETAYTFTALEQNTNYTVKVEITDKVGNTGKTVKTATTKTVPSVNDVIEIKDPVWNGGEASIEIKVDKEKLEEGEKVLIKINDDEWTELPEDQDTIPGLKDGDEVHIKITDGTNEGEEIVINIKDDKPPEINLELGTPTTSSIQATVTSATDAQTGIDDSATYKFSIKKASEEDTEYVEGQNTTSKQYNFTGLDQNTEYKIKVEVSDKAGNIGKAEETATTVGVPSGEDPSGGETTGERAIEFEKAEWNTEGKASVVVKTSTEFQIEYQIDRVSETGVKKIPEQIKGGTWTKVDASKKREKIENLNNKDIVYARLTDGKNSGDYALIEIKDTEEPKIEMTIGTPTTSSIQATVPSATDTQSGIDDSATYKFSIKKASEEDTAYQEKQNMTSKAYTFTGLDQNTEYTIKVEVADRVGNVGKAEETATTTGVPAGNDPSGGGTTGEKAIEFENEIWNEGKASIVVKTSTDYQIEYQIDTTTETGVGKTEEEIKAGSWTRVDASKKRELIGNLNNKDTVYARLTDGRNSGQFTYKMIKDETPPKIEMTIGETTKSSIQVTASAEDLQTGIEDNATYKFSIKEANQPDTSYQEKQNTANNTYKFEGLAVNKTYTIKVEVSDKAGNVGNVTKEASTLGIPAGSEPGAIEFEEPVWSGPRASVVVKTTTEYQIEYQIGSTTGTWTQFLEGDSEGTINDLSHNTVVYARLTDGVNHGEEKRKIIKDTIEPVVELEIQETTTSTIKVEATAFDNQSGISSTAKYYFYVKESSQEDTSYQLKQYTESNICTITELKQNTAYTVKVEISDIAGNKQIKTGETTTGGIPDGKDPSGVNTGAIQFEELGWTSGKASILVMTDRDFQIEYNINKTTGTWTKVNEGEKTETITGLSNGDTIYARLTDGKNYGDWASITIKDDKPPVIDNLDLQPTSSSIIATVTARDEESGISPTAKYKFSIKKTSEPDSSYEVKQEKTQRDCTFTGLDQNVSYTVKVEISDIAGNTTNMEKSVTTTSVPSGIGSIQFGAVSWSDGKASVVVSTTTNYQIQYQRNSTTGTWENVPVGEKSITVGNLLHGNKLYARLVEGANVGQHASADIIDREDPKVATIVLSKTSTNINTVVTADVTHKDLESGVKISECKWVINTTETEIGTDSSSYTGGTFTSLTQKINFDTTTEGKYYLHILTVDNAGNTKESISGVVKIIDPTLKEGDYVKYDVSYTDMITGYRFTAENGWRILDANGRDNNGAPVVKLISTGVPGTLSYIYNSIKSYEYNGTDGKWAANASQRQQYANKFYALTSNDYTCMYMAAGLYYNFGKIQFKNVQYPDDNSGAIKSINGSSATITGNAFLSGGATEVHNLTLTELNDARNRKEGVNLSSVSDKITSSNEPAEGIFKLSNLNKFNYSSEQGGYYWLASPNNYIIYGDHEVFYVNTSGEIPTSRSGLGMTAGIRPVVCIPTSVALEKVID